MAPKKETLLELCTNTAKQGNTIALHFLDYLSTVKVPPPGFEDLALYFLEGGRVLLSVKAGLTEATHSRKQLPADVSHELRECLRHVATTFAVLDRMVNKFRENEAKHGFGRFGKSFRMMFADTEIEKMKRSLVHCKETLMLNTLLVPSTHPEHKIGAAGDVGYTALAAVLEPSHTESGRASALSSQVSPAPAHRALDTPPLTPASATLTYIPTIHPSSPMLSAGFGEHASHERRSSVRTALSSESGKGRMTSSLLSDDLSEMKLSTSSAHIDDMIHAHKLNGTFPQEAVRVKHDSRTAPRWTPKHSTGTVTAASMSALVNAIHQRNHKMVEHLLDCGAPADGEQEHSLLIEAIAAHDLDSVRLLLLFGADVNIKDRAGYTPLYTATQASFFEAAELLLRYGADPNISAGAAKENSLAASSTESGARLAHLYLKHGADPGIIMDNGNTPFIQAMETSPETNVVKLMLLYDADPNSKNKHGETALFRAIGAHRLDLVNVLLDNGADVNLPGPKHMLWPAVHQQNILEVLLQRGAELRRAPGILELATSTNSFEAVTTLLNHGADPNSKKDGIYTPLCSAIRDNREELVEVLLEAGADPNLAALETPVSKCVSYHRAHLLPRLLAAGANPSHPKGILENAIANNDQDSLLLLLKHGVNANERGSSGNTALTTAIRNNRLDLLDILLSYGADPAVRGHEWPITMAIKNPEILAKLLPHIEVSRINKGALEMAVVADQIESVKLLLAKGVNVEDKNGGVFSPLTTSIREDRKAIFRFLLDEAGADPNQPGEHLPIIKAIRRHHAEDLSYIRYLLEKGADMNLMYRGWNAVLQTLEDGETEIFRLLTDFGRPDLKARDENGRRVIDIIHERGMKEELEILLSKSRLDPKMNDALSQLNELVNGE